MESLEIGIVGGGLMGFALAQRLARDGHRVTVLEQASQFGGLATHHDFGDFTWDRFYHVVLPTDSELISFLNEIGLGASLKWQTTQTGVFIEGEFHPVNNALDFLRFPPLSMLSKVRLAWTLLRASRIDDWRSLEQLSVEEWLCASCGQQTFERFWKPLLLAKLGENYHRVSAVFIWAYIKRMFSARQSAARKEQLGYISGAYKAVFDRLVESLESRGGAALSGVAVRSIASSPGGGICVKGDNEQWRFDKVIFTAPTNVLERIAEPNLVRIDDAGSEVEYLGVVCVVLATRKPLMPYYVLNVADEETPFTGVIGVSNVAPPSETAGLHLTYLPKYASADDPLWRQADEDVRAQFLAGLERLFPDYESAGVVSVHVNRAARVQPLQVIGYSKLAPRCETLHPDFYVLNTAQFLFGTLNNNEVVKAANAFVDQQAHSWGTAVAGVPPAVAST